MEYIASTIRNSDSELFQTLNENGEWNTWANWQIGLVYAKYLSPPFHAWGNEVIRARMEGKLVPVEEDRTQLLARALIEAMKEIEENREDANAFRTSGLARKGSNSLNLLGKVQIRPRSVFGFPSGAVTATEPGLIGR